MNMKLRDRLLRLKRRAGENLKVESLPPGLLSVLACTVAVIPGNYRAASGPAGPADSYGDAFARALGYADRTAMAAGIDTAPVGWSDRLQGILTPMLEARGIDASKATSADIAQMCGDELKTAGCDLPPSIRRDLRELVPA